MSREELFHMGIRRELKVAILDAGQSQREVAARSGVHENRFCAIVRGWLEPRPDERQAIAAALGKSIEELFDPASEETAPREPHPSVAGGCVRDARRRHRRSPSGCVM